MSELDAKYFDEICSVKFELKDGCVLRKGAWNEKTLSEWRTKFGNDFKSIESVINHLHIQSLFWLTEGEELDAEDMINAGKNLKEAWSRTLSNDFPKMNIKVDFDDRVLKEGWLGNMSVTAYQVSNHA